MSTDPAPSSGRRSRLNALAVWVWHVPRRLAILAVRGYQRFLSPIFGGQCRFHPSCSQYYILAVEKYGLISGTCRGFWRILKCQPFHPGGYDPP
ncbi:MAG: membrane protein insertion efficiency factor YidD [Planctomycetes bacterium]|nr:membrane protein insertion efficiency factor YidD [Planctomycetota bacterium]